MKQKRNLARRDGCVELPTGDYITKEEIDTLPDKTEAFEVLLEDGLHYHVNIVINAAKDRVHFHFPHWNNRHDQVHHRSILYNIFLAERGRYSIPDGIGPRNLYSSFSAGVLKQLSCKKSLQQSSSVAITQHNDSSQPHQCRMFSDKDTEEVDDSSWQPEHRLQSFKNHVTPLRNDMLKLDSKNLPMETLHSVPKVNSFELESSECEVLQFEKEYSSQVIENSYSSSTPAVPESSYTSTKADDSPPATCAPLMRSSLSSDNIAQELHDAVERMCNFKIIQQFKNASQRVDSLKSDLDTLKQERQRILGVMDDIRQYIAELEASLHAKQAKHEHVANQNAQIKDFMGKMQTSDDHSNHLHEALVGLTVQYAQNIADMEIIASEVEVIVQSINEYKEKLATILLLDEQQFERICDVHTQKNTTDTERKSILKSLTDCILKEFRPLVYSFVLKHVEQLSDKLDTDTVERSEPQTRTEESSTANIRAIGPTKWFRILTEEEYQARRRKQESAGTCDSRLRKRRKHIIYSE